MNPSTIRFTFVSVQERRAPQKLLNGTVHCEKVRLTTRSSGNKHQVPSGPNSCVTETGCFPKQSLDTVAIHSFSHPSADCKSVAVVAKAVGLGTQHEQSIRPRAPLAPYTLEIGIIPEAVLPLQHVFKTIAWREPRLLAVFLRCQDLSSLQTAPLQDSATAL